MSLPKVKSRGELLLAPRHFISNQSQRVQLTILQAICRHSEDKGAYLEH